MYQRGSQWMDFREILYWGFVRNSVDKPQICVNSDKNIGHFTQTLSYVYIVDSSAKYFVALRQCQGNLLLRFHGNADRFCIVYSYVHLNINTEGIHCCVSMATLIAFILLTATYRLTSIQRERIVAFQLQQWLRERAVSLHYTYVACSVTLPEVP
jgi:hypothetical protein